GHDRTRGISSAEEQHVEVLGHEHLRVLAAAGFVVGCRFCGADEGAEEFAVHLRSDGVNVETLAGKKFAGVFDAINARGFNLGFRKSSVLEFAEIIVFFESARDASDPEENALANFGKHFAARHNVGDGEAAAWFQHAKSFAEDRIFIGRKIDHAIRDDD